MLASWPHSEYDFFTTPRRLRSANDLEVTTIRPEPGRIRVIPGGVPTVLVPDPYRMYFYSHEPNEPPHVHIDRDDSSAKFWLDPVALAANLGFAPAELGPVQRLVVDNRALLLEKWHERFSS